MGIINQQQPGSRLSRRLSFHIIPTEEGTYSALPTSELDSTSSSSSNRRHSSQIPSPVKHSHESSIKVERYSSQDWSPSSYRSPSHPGGLKCLLLTLLPFLLLSLSYLLYHHRHLTSSTPLRSPHHTYLYATPFPNETPYEVHPIRTLIEEGKKLWKEKLERQSGSFDEAEKEYRRRYGREPPKGFEVWYEWAKSNDVQLLDEYDSIDEHITPFLSLRPSQLQTRITSLENTSGAGRDHAILTLIKGVRTWSGATWRMPVADSLSSLLEGIGHLLPDLKVPVYLHDASHTQLDWEAMKGYREAGRAGKWVDESTLPIAGSSPWTNRERTCAPDSPFRLAAMGLENQVPPAGPSFVRDHGKEMSYCDNPSNAILNGLTSNDVTLRPLTPSLALSRTTIDGDMVWPSTIQYNLNPENESAFKDKKTHKIVWRGSPDGIWVSPEMKWRQSQRFRLLSLTSSNSTSPRKLRTTSLDTFGREYQSDVVSSLSELNERYSDIKPTGGPTQCREEICDYLKQTMKFYPKASLEEMADHRYVFDVDGNAYSARFRTHLLSNQLPLKATIYREWYYDRLQPWVHYVPVHADYSDLYNILAFFDGGLDEEKRSGNHDELAEEIALAGRDWAERHWREVDMRAYVFRLLLEYARLMDPARER